VNSRNQRLFRGEWRRRGCG